MVPFIDDFEVSAENEPLRSTLIRIVVPEIMNTLAADGFDVLVSRSLQSKAEYNAIHAGDPLLTRLPLADARYHPSIPPTDVFCVYLEHGGELVASCVMRLVWAAPSFAEILEGLSLLYERPDVMGERAFAICRPPIARDTLKDVHVALSSGGHVRKDFRKTFAYEGLWRLARLKSLAEWRWSYAVTLLEPDTAQKIGFRRYCYQLAAGGVMIHDGEAEHEYLLYLSERDHVRDMFGRIDAGDLSCNLGDFTATELKAAVNRRGSVRATEKAKR